MNVKENNMQIFAWEFSILEFSASVEADEEEARRFSYYLFSFFFSFFSTMEIFLVRKIFLFKRRSSDQKRKMKHTEKLSGT